MTRRMRHSPTPEQEGLAAQAYRDGLSIRQVADRFDMSYGTTVNTLQSQQVTMRPPGSQPKPRPPDHPDRNPATRAGIVAQYGSGLSIAAVAAARGYSYALVQRVLNEEGVQVRNQHRPPLEVSDPALAARLVTEYQADDQPSMRELGRRHGLSYARVNRALNRAGITIRGSWQYRQDGGGW